MRGIVRTRGDAAREGTEARMRAEWMNVELALHRLDPQAPLPELTGGHAGFLSVTRTDRELSILIDAGVEVASTRREGPYAAARIEGTLAPDLVGILLRLLAPLADAGIPILAISTFDTDYVLVRAHQRQRATEAWLRAGIECGR